MYDAAGRVTISRELDQKVLLKDLMSELDRKGSSRGDTPSQQSPAIRTLSAIGSTSP